MMKIKDKQLLLVSGLLCGFGNISVASTYTMTGGSFQWFDSIGEELTPVSHNNVNATIDFTSRSGSFTTATPFYSDEPWRADIADIQMFDGISGEPQIKQFQWEEKLYLDAFGSPTECRVLGSLDGCSDSVAYGDEQIGSTKLFSQAYTLKEGQFALSLFWDWSGKLDIPLLAVFNIGGIDADGNMSISAVDTGDENFYCVGTYSLICSADAGGNGVAGSAMFTSPFPGQTMVLGGQLSLQYDDGIAPVAASPVPVPSAVWLFLSGLVGMASLVRRKS